MSYSLVRLGTYEDFKSRLSTTKEGEFRKPKTHELLAAACLAGALGGIAGNPAGAWVSPLALLVINADADAEIGNRYPPSPNDKRPSETSRTEVQLL